MKKVTLLLTLAIAMLTASAQKNEVMRIFDTYQDTEGITTINIAKPMFKMLSKLKLEIDDATVTAIKPLLADINSINILVTNNVAENIIDSTVKANIGTTKVKDLQLLQQQINNAVKRLNYEELVTVNSNGKKIKFLTAKTNGNDIENLLLSVTMPEKNVLLFLDGKLSMDNVNKLIENAK